MRDPIAADVTRLRSFLLAISAYVMVRAPVILLAELDREARP